MVSELKKETMTLKLTLNATDVEDFLSILNSLRFPVKIALPKLNGKAKENSTTNGQLQKTDLLNDPIWLEKQAKVQTLMLKLAKMDADDVPELSEEEMMELINSEIKADHAEQIALEKG